MSDAIAVVALRSATLFETNSALARGKSTRLRVWHRLAMLLWRNILVPISLATGCEGDSSPLLGELRFEGEVADFYASESLRACGGTFRHLDDFASRFRDDVGPYGETGRHRFHWLTEEDFSKVELCDGFQACLDELEGALVECEQEPMEGREGDQWNFELDFACSDPDVLGPRGERVWVNVPVEITVDGDDGLLVHGGGTAAIRLSRCDGGCLIPLDVTAVANEDGAAAALQQGRHLLRVSKPVDDPTPVRVILGRV